MDLDYEPATKMVYTDLGLILLGHVLERVGGAPLDELARGRVFEPLGMGSTLYVPPVTLRPRIAPTERDPWRGRVLAGIGVAVNEFDVVGQLARFGLDQRDEQDVFAADHAVIGSDFLVADANRDQFRFRVEFYG